MRPDIFFSLRRLYEFIPRAVRGRLPTEIAATSQTDVTVCVIISISLFLSSPSLHVERPSNKVHIVLFPVCVPQRCLYLSAFVRLRRYAIIIYNYDVNDIVKWRIICVRKVYDCCRFQTYTPQTHVRHHNITPRIRYKILIYHM